MASIKFRSDPCVRCTHEELTIVRTTKSKNGFIDELRGTIMGFYSRRSKNTIRQFPFLPVLRADEMILANQGGKRLRV